jgi:hypothetical protein
LLALLLHSCKTNRVRMQVAGESHHTKTGRGLPINWYIFVIADSALARSAGSVHVPICIHLAKYSS